MPSNVSDVALLLADIIGSTPLYERIGDAAALRQIAECLDRMKAIAGQERGTFIRSKGDDVLCAFADPSAALRAVRQMLSQQGTGPLGIHAGLHFGRILHAEDDIFGDAVNVTARLAALAKPGEVLISRSLVDQLPEAEAQSLRLLDHLTFKGKSVATEIYALLDDDATPSTEMGIAHGPRTRRGGHRQASPAVTVTLCYAGRSQLCEEKASLSIGRAPDCDVVIGHPSVSRMHATLSVRRGKVQLDDRSSLGTYVSTRDGEEFFLRRETVLLTGSGIISPAMRPDDARAERITYEVTRHRREADS